MANLTTAYLQHLCGTRYKSTLTINKKATSKLQMAISLQNPYRFPEVANVLAIMYGMDNREIMRWHESYSVGAYRMISFNFFTYRIDDVPYGQNKIAIYVNGRKLRTITFFMN